MINLSKFAETLNELIFDNGEMNNKKFAAAVGLPEPTVLRYRQGKHTPNLKNLIIIADYFKCPIDFLIGREPETAGYSVKPCPPFSEQIVYLVKSLGISYKDFYTKAKIPASTFFEWKNGSALPNLYSVIKLADEFNCRVDYILGRES